MARDNAKSRHDVLTETLRRVALAVTAVFVVSAGSLAFSERARHNYHACERAGRVAVTLAHNVWDYHRALRRQDEADFKAILSACHKRCAERTLVTIEKNGSVFIKLGQHLSSLNYLLPNEWCDTFIPLQDKAPVSGFSSIEAMVEQDTGKKMEDYFDDIERRPIGAASLAQVHIASLKGTGEKVAVKFQHPTLDEWAALDMWLTSFTFSAVKRFFPTYDLTWLSEEMQASLPKELDFREEGENAKRVKEYFSKVRNTPLVVPDVIWAQRRILVMEYVSGHRPDDLDFLDSNGISRDEVSAALARIFNEMIFGEGAPLHCDPHGGNLAIRLNSTKRKPRNFDIVLYDHGLYREIPRDLRRKYAHLWLAVLDLDEPNMRKYAKEVANVGDKEFPLFASAITGRDYSVVQKGVARKRNALEKQAISDAVNDGLVQGLVNLLGKVPRVMLLILKTNDLTRSLDENLHTTQGPIRTFLILARYAAKAVFVERIEEIRGTIFWPSNFFKYSYALGAYAQVSLKLRAYELYLSARRHLGMPPLEP
ncbi:hypothetical protein AMS68_003015 [Peltaster fructicola]|uniref:ABC1 atypical kinase-like domain-containing protein n=1 Tax=Peltaster fructicola TaxID=286661 RepID=A0A6H0XS96_9PEZI|nr:hypothetical protein AMS68_003015 [Peltaster fructicola]